MIKPWKKLSSKLTYQDEWLTVRSHRLEKPNGTILDPFHVVESSEWVCVCAFTDEGQIVAIKEYRIGADAVTLGIVGGVTEADDVDFEAAAHRELEEETGYTVREMIPIGRAHANWANQNNQISYYIGFGAEPAGVQNLDVGEDIEPILMPYEDFLAYDFEGPKQTHHAAALFFVERYFKQYPERRLA